MSETKEHQPAYISRVHLKGYKSIRDLEIDFKAGLNIIIGPNGSGKTNFLEFLDRIVKRDFEAIGNFDATIEGIGGFFLRGKTGILKIIGKRNNSDLLNPKIEIKGKTFVDGKIKDKVNMTVGDGKTYVINFNNSFFSFFTLDSFVEHRYPDLMSGVSIPAEVKINFDKNIVTSIEYSSDVKRDFYFKSLLMGRELTKPKQIEDILEINSQIVDALKKFTPIESIRLNKKYFIVSGSEDRVTINNILTEFKISDNWLKWAELSDGTKRMFYIVSKIICETRPVNCDLVLLEEPELGIHPDQLYLLMDFLKEQSKEKQIIITTHSPEVLNILDKTELDRIIVTRYDAEKGTQMHHLSPKKIRKGVSYMSKEGLTLKDFWVHSNLEEYDEEEYEIR
jgi:AAA15 family ATPase/GTPase